METNEKQPNLNQDDEISLKELIAKIQSVFKLLKSKLLFLVILGILGGGIGIAIAFLSKPRYDAKLTFVMRSESNSALSQLAGLTSLLGVGSSGSSSNSLDRIVELLASERIVGEALLKKVEIDGRKDLLINHLISIQEFKKSWIKDTLLSKADFSGDLKIDQLNRSQRKGLRQCVDFVAGPEGIMEKNYDKKSGIITLKVKHPNEEMAIALSTCIYKYLVEFYTNESVSTINNNVKILQQKVDSIKSALSSTQRTSAQKIDQGLGILLQQDRVEQKTLGLKENILSVMYAEAQKNLEQLNYLQATTSPSFSVIDMPYSPIEPERKSKLMYGAVGGFLGVFLSSLWVVVGSWYRRMMKEL